MKYNILFCLLIAGASFSSESSILGPIIQCTIVKVHSVVEILGFKKFPQLYQSINNDPLSSTLLVANKEFKKLKPKTILKTKNLEKIIINHEKGRLELELNGKPISRNGILKESGQLIADITCH